MAYNPTLRSSFNPIKESLNNTQSPDNSTRIGRVRDIVLTEDHPTYTQFGQQALRGVHYELIEEPYIGEEVTSLPFAFSDTPFYKGVPVLGELIEVINKPKALPEESSFKDVAYYNYPIATWNSTHHNYLPDPKDGIIEAFLGENTPERNDVRNLQPFPGDVIIEGRLGQSIRFGGYSHPMSTLTDNENNSDPYFTLRVGQEKDEQNISTYVEDINQDNSSLYLTSNHSIPLEISTKKLDTFKNEDQPTSVPEFKGSQAILNSDRLVLHTKSDSLFLNSKKSILAGSETFNIDSTSYISVDAPEVFIGKQATEPAVLGNQNEALLKRLLGLLTNIANGFNAVKDPVSAVSVLAGLGPVISSEVNAITSKLDSIKSKKIKVE